MIRKIPYEGHRTRRHKGRVITHLELGDLVVLTIPEPIRLRHVKNYNSIDKRLGGFIGKYIGQTGGSWGVWRIPVFQVGRLHVYGYQCWWIRRDEAERILAAELKRREKEGKA